LDSASFSKLSFGGFELFQGVTRRKKLFLADSKFFGLAAAILALRLFLAGLLVADQVRTPERRGGGKRKITIARMRIFSNKIQALIALAVDMPLRRREGLGAVA
jgi:hypothetical protein